VSKRTATWLAWSICALSLALAALSLLLLYLNYSHPGVHIFDYWVQDTVMAVGYSTVGAVITSRRPENVMGWLFCAIGFISAAEHFNSEYAIYGLLAQPGSLPGAEVFAWLAYWLWVPWGGLFVFLFLMFPTGRLPSRRWRWFAGFSAIAVLVGAASASLSSGYYALGPVPNPLGIESLKDALRIVEPLIFALILPVAAGSVFVRLRHAGEVERQQIKWFAYLASIVVIGAGTLTYVGQSEAMGASWVSWAGFALSVVGLLGLPIAMGIAILRYRLYEIDIIINRTLVYGALTAILALFYFGSVTALQYLLILLTGQGNTLAIVASTLAIAALFNPLRRRIQSFIDRRFYRRKYDARKILEAFGSRLRDETDLEKLSEDLAEVVDETMQPAHVSVILRSEVPSTSTTTKEQGQQDQQTTRHEEG
jgi:hypothetical protein